jgi:hypothetical protein
MDRIKKAFDQHPKRYSSESEAMFKIGVRYHCAVSQGLDREAEDQMDCAVAYLQAHPDYPNDLGWDRFNAGARRHR